MSCNKLKNSHYKSSVQFFNNTSQPILITNTITNPLVVTLLGTQTTDTGVALDVVNNAIDVECTGLYRFSTEIVIDGVVAGNISFALTLDGVVLQETLKTITVAATSLYVVPIETVKYLQTCCNLSSHSIGVIAYSDGDATGNITNISGNAIKLA